MLLQTVVAGLFLAANTQATPVGQDDPAFGEIVRFKRDAVLDTRDLELAELHGVNLTEMHKHSVIKRDDGDHFTIWVDNRFADVEGPQESPHAKRQSARLWPGSRFVSAPGVNDYCNQHDRKDWTSSNSPTTGGIIAMSRWADNNDGYFPWGDNDGGWGWRTVLIGGSNGGANARYRAQMSNRATGQVRSSIGTRDVHNDAEWTLSRGQNYNGNWRASSYGWETCGWPGTGWGRANYEITFFDQNV